MALSFWWATGGSGPQELVWPLGGWNSRPGPGLLNSDNLFVSFITTKHGGSGIGLILNHQIAEAHGGVLQLSPSALTGRSVRQVLALPITYDGTAG